MMENSSSCRLVTSHLSVIHRAAVLLVWGNAGMNKLDYANVRVYRMQLVHLIIRDLVAPVLLFIIPVYSDLQEFYCEQCALPCQQQPRMACANHLYCLQ